jgi:hypothetical protein
MRHTLICIHFGFIEYDYMHSLPNNHPTCGARTKFIVPNKPKKLSFSEASVQSHFFMNDYFFHKMRQIEKLFNNFTFSCCGSELIFEALAEGNLARICMKF